MLTLKQGRSRLPTLRKRSTGLMRAIAQRPSKAQACDQTGKAAAAPGVVPSSALASAAMNHLNAVLASR